tara:strand:+ start:140 stop:388 length:249 start_codon:yes stop_codon:yes gene_type:complete
VCNASPFGEIMKDTEIKEIHRKLALPTKRDDSGKLIPTEFSEKESHFIIFEMMHEMREENRKKNGGRALKRHWNKANKRERI